MQRSTTALAGSWMRWATTVPWKTLNAPNFTRPVGLVTSAFRPLMFTLPLGSNRMLVLGDEVELPEVAARDGERAGRARRAEEQDNATEQ